MGAFTNGVYVPTIGEVGWGANVSDFLTRAGNASIDVMASPYGAVGDGTTDDTIAITAAYDAARVNGLTVFFAPGRTFIVATELNPTGTTTIAYGATLKHKPSVSPVNMFQPTGACAIYGGTIDMNKANVTGSPSGVTHAGFYLPATGGWSGTVIIRDVTIKNSYGPAIRLGATTASVDPDTLPVAKALVTGCTFTSVNYALYMVGCTDTRIANNSITLTTNEAVLDFLSLRTTVIGNDVVGSGSHGIVTEYSRQFVATGNSCNNNTLCGICVGGGDVTYAPADRCSITGNTCRTNGTHGIQIDTTLGSAPTATVNVHGAVTGNVCSGNTIHGICLQNSAYVSVAGNTVQGNVQLGIQVIGYRCAIAGNTCTGNGAGIGVQGTAGLKGEHRISGNSMNGETTQYSYDAYARIGTTVDIPHAALGTTAPDGFLRIPTCAGVPSGTPTAITGTIPLVYDTTNNNLYIYNGGWKKTTVFS